ncbi:MAG: DPP IV N-terminal domain-containing protein, partial [Bacteroidaceae bacterium]|nr:DPP IV N-terminal domain-containing protein [Bacteroidaceae bacterium]
MAGYTAMPKSDYYTVVKRAGIERYSFATGDRLDMLVSNADLDRLSKGFVNIGKLSSYEFSSDEKKVVLAIDEESIWRRSSLAYYYVYDIENNPLTMVADTNPKLHFAFLSEDGQKVL